jgi:hypothetical protein
MKKLLLFFVLALSINMVYGQVEVLNESFDGCAQPAGWNVGFENNPTGDMGGNTGVGACNGLQLFTFECVDQSSNFPSAPANPNFSSCVAIIDDDNAGSAFDGIAWIETPVMDLSAGGVNLTFDFSYYGFDFYDMAFIVYAWDGANWNEEYVLYQSNGFADSPVVDLSAYSNADFQLRFATHDWYSGGSSSWAYGVAFDNVVVNAIDPGNGDDDDDPVSSCFLDCPGDLTVFLDPGACCWTVEYDARSVGCDYQYTEILASAQPDPLVGYVNEADVYTYNDYLLSDITTPGGELVADSYLEPWTMNGPNSGPYNTFSSTNYPFDLSLESQDFGACPGIGANAVGNQYFTTINFVAPYDGVFSVDWDYTTDDFYSLYDPFVELTYGGGPNLIFVNYIVSDLNTTATGSITRNMSEGDYICLAVWTDAFDCGAQVDFSNFLYAPAYVPKNGIYVENGPIIGEEVCPEDGVQTVKLGMYENDVLIDSCEFDITVNDYPNPTSTLACNDYVQVSLGQRMFCCNRC